MSIFGVVLIFPLLYSPIDWTADRILWGAEAVRQIYRKDFSLYMLTTWRALVKKLARG
jgi:hypothetical protein